MSFFIILYGSLEICSFCGKKYFGSCFLLFFFTLLSQKTWQVSDPFFLMDKGNGKGSSDKTKTNRTRQKKGREGKDE